MDRNRCVRETESSGILLPMRNIMKASTASAHPEWCKSCYSLREPWESGNIFNWCSSTMQADGGETIRIVFVCTAVSLD